MRLMVSPLQLFSGLPHYGKCAKQQNNRCGEPLVRKNCSQTAYQAKAVYRTVSITMPDRTVQPERKPAFARPSGTTTSATAPAAKRNTTTDSSTASDRCMCSILGVFTTPIQQVHLNYKIIIRIRHYSTVLYCKRKNPNLITVQYSTTYSTVFNMSCTVSYELE